MEMTNDLEYELFPKISWSQIIFGGEIRAVGLSGDQKEDFDFFFYIFLSHEWFVYPILCILFVPCTLDTDLIVVACICYAGIAFCIDNKKYGTIWGIREDINH